MRIVSTGYSKTEEYSSPHEWLNRINFYTGILEELSKQHEVSAIERINYEGEHHQNGVDYYFICFKKQVERFPRKMHHLLKNLKPDVMLVNGFIFPLQIIQLRIALGKKVRIIVLHRAEKPFKGIKKWLQVLADGCVNAYLFASAEFGEQWIKNNIIRDENKIKEVMQASSAFVPEAKPEARRKLGIEDPLVYLWVGRLEKNKDPLTVVRAFISFQTVYPAARLYMIFQTEELLDEIKSMISSCSVFNAIRLVGKVEHSNLQTWYSSADFIISGSHYEGSGIAISEAMSCGCIPLVTDIISFRKMTGNCGLLYNAGDENSLLTILKDSLLLDIEKQQQKVLEEFRNELSYSAIARKINQVLEEVHK